MPPDLSERLIPTPAGFSDEVKRQAAKAERAWDAATGMLGALSATGTAALAAGVAIPPLAPFLGLVAGSSFYFKLRAKWAKEDPPRADFYAVAEYRPPTLDLTPVMPPGRLPPGAGLPTLLHAAGASLEATIVCVERAMGADAATREAPDAAVRTALSDRMRETYEHARRTEMLTKALSDEIQSFVRSEAAPDIASARRRTANAPYPTGATFAATVDGRVLGRLVAAGVDERLLDFPLPRYADGGGQEPAKVLSEAATAADALGAELRQWAWEASVHPSLASR